MNSIYLTDLMIARMAAFKMLYNPYIWGGNSPIKGLDCSGFVIEILKSIGRLPSLGDWTAQGLFDAFSSKRIDETDLCEGCLIFWKNDDGRANHVEYALNPYLSIGARGGRSIKTEKDVIEKGAYIKIRPWKDRPQRFIKGYTNPYNP